MENWKDIEGFRDLYQISDLGRVRRKDTKRVLKPLTLTKDYKGVRLYINNKEAKSCKIHRLVAIYFIDNPLNLPQVNHIDGNKSNNKVTNLEWCSNDFNMNHAVCTGLVKRGEDRFNSKCTEESLYFLQELIDKGFTIKQLSVVYNIDKNSMKEIVKGRTYKHLHLDIHYSNPPEKKFNTKYIDKELYEKLNSSLKDNTVLNTLIESKTIIVQCNA